MNLSPDFKISMETFLENYERVVGKGTVDAVVAVDTKVLVDLLKVLGPIGVPGWGNFSSENDPRCDCPQVFYELERYADKPVTGFREERKGIIGPLMHSIILNAMGSPRKKWPESRIWSSGIKGIIIFSRDGLTGLLKKGNSSKGRKPSVTRMRPRGCRFAQSGVATKLAPIAWNRLSGRRFSASRK